MGEVVKEVLVRGYVHHLCVGGTRLAVVGDTPTPLHLLLLIGELDLELVEHLLKLGVLIGDLVNLLLPLVCVLIGLEEHAVLG